MFFPSTHQNYPIIYIKHQHKFKRNLISYFAGTWHGELWGTLWYFLLIIPGYFAGVSIHKFTGMTKSNHLWNYSNVYIIK